jgi:hypothetical protein
VRRPIHVAQSAPRTGSAPTCRIILRAVLRGYP